jgi:UDP-N-acetylglucosamine diphosphorylase/glucosamine-1-phosphate N-acetyltransferase
MAGIPARICLYEGDPRPLGLFTYLKPIWELRAGALTLRERWSSMFPETELIHVGRPEIADVHTERTGHGITQRVERAHTLIVDARLVPGPGNLSALALAAETPCRLVVRGERVGALLGDGPDLEGGAGFESRLAEASAGLPEREVDAPLLGRLPDFIGAMDRLVRDDVACVASSIPRSTTSPEGVRVLGEHDVHVADDARLDPGTTLDAREGPIAIGPGAVVSFGTWLVGPASIGAGSHILGGTVGPIVGIGPVCRVRGEVAESFFQGYTNKAHDGFIGHSVLGEWVNLGALTTCSDLKNNYSEIRLPLSGGEEETGLRKLGTFVGDHAKTAIGTLLSTGSVIGVGANVFGFASLAPRAIPDFAWGTGPAGSTALDRFLETAERVMARRGVTLGAATRSRMAELHARAGS